MKRRVGAAALSIVFALFLAGCASGVVVMTHPRTGQTVECKAQPGGGLISTQIDNCVKAYESSGYKITGDTR